MTTLRIRIAGWFEHEDGWGRQSQEFANALAKYSEVERIDLGHIASSDLRRLARRAATRLIPVRDGSVGVAIARRGAIWALKAQYRIVFFVWETSLIPEAWLRELRSVDVVWTPSHWGRDLLVKNGISLERVRVVPLGVDPCQFCARTNVRGQDVFRFLTVGKWEERKGSALLVRAFCREFRPEEPVQLVLHCDAGYARSLDFRSRAEAIAAEEGVRGARLTPSYHMPRASYIDLLRSCHAFVLATRAEAWGLPVLEAMACGLPCIVTDYSGLTEFVHQNNAYLVRVRAMTNVHDPEFFDARLNWGEWADPDIDHFRQQMRSVYEHGEEARAVGNRAAAEVRSKWTWDRAAATAVRSIRELTCM